MKRLIAIVLCLATLICTLSACKHDKYQPVVVTTSLAGKTHLVGDESQCKFPLTEDDATLKIMIVSDYDPNEIFVLKKYEEKTGVHVDWTRVDNVKSARSEAVDRILRNGNECDLIMRGKVSMEKLIAYAADGYILDLTKDDLLKNNAPHCWAYLQSHPTALASITNPDGSIYCLPQVNSGAELRVSRKLFVNKAWFNKAKGQGLLDALPTTTQEFYDMLKVFSTLDGNGNGLSDEIPLCPADWASVQDAFFGAFGLGNRGAHNFVVDSDPVTGDARYIATSEGYKDFLQYFQRLYSEQLLDQNVFVMSSTSWTNSIAADKIGVFASTNLASVPAEQADNWIAIQTALEGPNGDDMWAAVRADFHSVGAAVIPSTCSNPELVLQWLDYFWTDEGTLFYHMGIEGETFVANSDGSYDYSPEIYKQITQSKSFDDVIYQYSPYPGGGNPTVEIAPYFMGGEMADIPAQAARSLFQYKTDVFWPNFTFTATENASLLTYKEVTTACTDNSKKFIMGTQGYATWEEYLALVNTTQRDGIVTIYQAAIDRYEASLNQD